jgi:hypothetical protein
MKRDNVHLRLRVASFPRHLFSEPRLNEISYIAADDLCEPRSAPQQTNARLLLEDA